jgi:hypothetical protein
VVDQIWTGRKAIAHRAAQPPSPEFQMRLGDDVPLVLRSSGASALIATDNPAAAIPSVNCCPVGNPRRRPSGGYALPGLTDAHGRNHSRPATNTHQGDRFPGGSAGICCEARGQKIPAAHRCSKAARRGAVPRPSPSDGRISHIPTVHFVGTRRPGRPEIPTRAITGLSRAETRLGAPSCGLLWRR